MVICTVMAQNHFFFYIPLEILEFDLPIRRDRIMDLVHAVINTLVHGLDPSGDVDLALQFRRFVFTDLRLQFFYQLICLFCSDKFR